jgi:hypothetical protein
MSATKILEEAQNLNRVIDRLDSLADQHPKALDALLIISRGIRDSAVFIGIAGHDQIIASLRIAIGRANSWLPSLHPVCASGLRTGANRVEQH